MKVKLKVCLIVYIGLALSLTGCWNSRELNELAIVSGIGIDQGTKPGEYSVTFQVINPSATATSQGANSGASAITIYTSTDHTVFGALRRTSKRASRQLFFAHTQLLVLGESIAKSGIDGVLDIFERSHELRLNTAVMISRDTDAASILKVFTPQESIPSIGLVKKIQNTSSVWGENPKINVFELINKMTGVGGFTISGLRMIGNVEAGKKKSNLDQSEAETILTMGGQAVFNKGKLVKWIDGPEARGTDWILDKILETNVDIDSGEQQKAVAVNVLLSKTKVTVELREGIPIFHVNVSEEGNINETKVSVDLGNPKEIIKLEEAMEKQTKKEIEQAFHGAQQAGVDYLNFGNELKRTNPAAWKSVENEWNQVFTKGTLDLKIEAYIRGTGMRLAPFMSSEEK
ncbi:Ger(x)C family spore germination protein [Paenibacillus sp. sgz5001063]|uniref:Ger(x)C family spore germination protein n=1 Tax=Paenibacillus sp. sgz5001063 TaxID=3242474 RepID=UPI0036D33970